MIADEGSPIFSCAWVRPRRMEDCSENSPLHLRALEVALKSFATKAQRLEDSQKSSIFMHLGARPAHVIL